MKIRYIAVLAMAAAVSLSSCVKDLDTKPLNDSDFTSDKAYDTPESYRQGLAKIYGGFVLVGPNEGSADINVSDAGSSELNRAFWTLQEISTDAGKCAWVNDAWVAEVNTNAWSATKNDAIFAAYNRVMMLVTQANEYFRQTSDEKLSQRGVDAALRADIQRYRSEARYLRAYAYWMGMDLFGRMPFVTENDPVGTFNPPQAESADLFRFIESELLALTEDANFREARTNTYPQVDKGAAWGLLARLYLNAETYTGTPRWSDARDAAARVIASGYVPAKNYKALFMGDNGENPDARNELIFAIAYDKERTKSFGGTSYIIAAAMAGGDKDGKEEIASDGWGGIRSSWDYANRFFGAENPDYAAGTYECKDQRAMFYVKDREQDVTDLGLITQGWAVTKFSNRGFLTGENLGSGAFSSTDMPMIRLGEMYLIYAEANLRAGGSATDPTALGYLNALRKRAFSASDYTPLSSYNLDYIFDERSRELFWEGHRRTDLIRFGLYLSSEYLWPWKGGVKNGRSLDARYARYPLVIEDLIMNPNLSQNAGY